LGLAETVGLGWNISVNKVIAISGDNTNTNFGGLKQKGTNNVFCKIKDLNRGVIGLGCVAHMTQSCAHSSINTIPLDIEGLVVKIFGYFHVCSESWTAKRIFCLCWTTVWRYTGLQ
jgi:hypothetical protein